MNAKGGIYLMKLPFGQNKFIRIFDILCRERERMIFFSANLFTTLVSACERTIKNRAISALTPTEQKPTTTPKKYIKSNREHSL